MFELYLELENGKRIGLFLRAKRGAEEYLAGDSTMAYQASVEGNTLVLKLEQPTEESILIRFAREAWYQVNLVNSAGVPAIPFETRC